VEKNEGLNRGKVDWVILIYLLPVKTNNPIQPNNNFFLSAKVADNSTEILLRN
jgi:hypothetical protein